jgi:hypothetical protein
MRYLHSKIGATPVPTPSRYMELAQEIRKPTTIAEAYDTILYLSDLKAKGEIDIESADSLINDLRLVLNAMVDAAKLIAAAQDPNQVQRIPIEGGLPAFPGTAISHARKRRTEGGCDPITTGSRPTSQRRTPVQTGYRKLIYQFLLQVVL